MTTYWTCARPVHDRATGDRFICALPEGHKGPCSPHSLDELVAISRRRTNQ